MILCDYCLDFYHYDCVGIECAQDIQFYKCPNCLMKGQNDPIYTEGLH